MDVKSFNDWDLSVQTREGLKNAHYSEPTLIQKLVIGPALEGSDVVGSAKTGSGKTLAFLIPILERLKHLNWDSHCGTGALIITPTRELCAQIFFVLKRIGRHHHFSAGAAFGGNTATAQKIENKSIGRAQILLATPGRLLDHLEAGHLNLDNLQILAIDEADKLLEMGFREQIDLLISYLPHNRQTLLFSATQSRSTDDLSRVLMQSEPFYAQTEVVNKNLDHFVMPSGLIQIYVVTPLHEKINVLWTFIKLKDDKKTLVFLDTCKQVRYIHESFKQLKSKMTVLQLHGKMKQHHRLEAYNTFRRKKSVVLFATDVAARGLDFPDVDWVLQVDAPTEAKTYVHRVGRTARYNKNGQAVTLVHPEEEECFVDKLKQKGISIQRLRIREDNMFNAVCKLPSKITVNKNDIKGMAERAVVAYLRQYCFFRPHSKSGYNPKQLDVEAFAYSYGLPAVPILSKKLNKALGRQTHRKRTEEVKLFAAKDESEVSEEESDSEQKSVQKKKPKTKIELAKQSLRKAKRVGLQLHSHVTFGEDDKSKEEEEVDSDSEGRLNLTVEVQRLREEEKSDRKAFRDLLRERKREEKMKIKLKKMKDEEDKKQARRKWLGLPNDIDHGEDESMDDEEERENGSDDRESAESEIEEETRDTRKQRVPQLDDSGEDLVEPSSQDAADEDDEMDIVVRKKSIVEQPLKKTKKRHGKASTKSSKRLKLSGLESLALGMTQ